MAFPQVGEREVVDETVIQHPAADKKSVQATQLLLLALKALSQRTVIALSNLFTLIGLASAFWLWWTVLVNPTVNQLVGVGGYSVFLLLLEYVRRIR
jgi:hypothetical protein